MSKIYLSSKGIKPTIDNSTIINNAISKAKERDTIIFPELGKFPIYKTLLQVDKVLYWEGNNSQLLCLQTALIIKGNPDLKSFIRDLDFVNYDQAGDGVLISSVVVMENVQVNGFIGNGLVVSADVTNGTNASGSIFRNILIANNKGNGIYLQGGDANKCSFYDADVRDNGENGIYDHSFLGNSFTNCMAHSNGKSNYRADDANNRATFVGCYSEQGSAPEFLAGAATWHGGLPANGFELSQWAKVYCDESV